MSPAPIPEAASSTPGKCVDAPVRYFPNAIMACRNYRNQLALLTADSALWNEGGFTREGRAL